ncbi:lytic transglycosylase domain-containing protein [Serratia sp. AKBS12]|uniref:lytic transglycosylase domain-containing protein n=1 Tax=Serratia sp. AKBS12 TaxID=2974597 RepID=UPI0021669B2F|nr:lytic transglycosylase domain-containing protein [Serratia sp. AKBS12]MCS3408347.1 lytic transglycosylase domain-containing protein [Serratia sp. AKBS12]
MRAVLFTLLLLTATVDATCWKQAGERYGIEPTLLQAIAITESSLDPAAINQNKDGSYDIGLMQINSNNLPALKKYQISQRRLLNDPCLSVMTGAWILAGFMRRHGYSWEAVGAYNAGSAPKRNALRQHYARRVQTHYQRLQQHPAPERMTQ